MFGFRVCCRPIIVIDGTYLKGMYKGVMFVATTMDGNEQIFPLAFGFGDGENDQSWSWFLIELRNVIRSPPELIIISNHYTNVNNAIEKCFSWLHMVFPNSTLSKMLEIDSRMIR